MLLSRDKEFPLPHGSAKLPALYAVVTRYNLEMEETPSDRNAWMEARIKIFRSVCLPSVLAQTHRPDLWLLGFDGEFQETAAPVLEAVKDHPWIVPVWQFKAGGSYEHFSLCVKREVARHLRSDHSHVIMTRLDNDDALGINFCRYVSHYSADIAAARQSLSEFWISFPFGADYFRGRCLLNVYYGNAFQTQVMTKERFLKRTVYFNDHTLVVTSRNTALFMPVTREPMWLRHVHGGNILNARSRARLSLVPTRKALQHFGLDRDMVETLQAGRRWSAAARRVVRTVMKRLRRAG